MSSGVNVIGTLEGLTLSYAIPVFYSTNAWIKYFINENYRKGKPYVWCSECFEGHRKPVSGMPPMARSSSPLQIYRELLDDVASNDAHSSKIAQQQHSLNSLAVKWQAAGEIGKVEFEEIIALANRPVSNIWRPVIYVIPQDAIHPSRIDVVHPKDRAGAVGREYIIKDLNTSEFDILEPAKC